MDFFKQVKAYSVNANDYNIKIYGISQNSDTKDYIMILQDVCCSGNIKIDKLIQEMHLKINSKNDTIFEWVPYNQFDNIKEISKSNFTTIYSAIWKNFPLYYDNNNHDLITFNDKYTIPVEFSAFYYCTICTT